MVRIVAARDPLSPSDLSSPSSTAASRAGDGNSRCKAATGVSIGSPRRLTRRPAKLVAAFTDTRWPRIAAHGELKAIERARDSQAGATRGNAPPTENR